ncbi:hypothetical protein WN51_03456 [Melipona quadrifasciata]|uniref:Uncharacterized protein n=1 Tax=Melipona quadrifasciata TaxID=166423 RepID=A0A0N0BKW2_9HYME|nr:hypothetical protein WN51_03456 [Melipona quadrifasciata]
MTGEIVAPSQFSGSLLPTLKSWFCMNGTNNNEEHDRHSPYRNEYHGEYQVLSKQRHDQRRRWNDLDDQQEKHVKTDENGNGERDL